MADIFSDTSERGDIINNVATTRGVAPWVIEKDLWVCWTLARLNELDGIPRLTFDPKLLRAVVENKAVFFRESKARYELVTTFDLNCAPHDALAAAMRADFRAMESMFFPESTVPTFDEALATLAEIDLIVAGWKAP